MNTYLGIDLGTSGVKILLVSKDGKIIDEVTEEYPTYYPYENWSEQNPIDWLNGVRAAIQKIMLKNNPLDLKGISFGGQMHGLVILDENDKVIRPCILWNDGRSDKETKYLNDNIKAVSKETGNMAFAGFTAPKLLWVKENEPDNFKKIKKIMLPKDYIAYSLTGVFSTDYSDASGTLLLDVKNKRWSNRMLSICSITKDMLPRLYESYDVIGTVKEDIAKALGISDDTLVIAGASDNAAAAIGTNTIDDGSCNISIGTSGTIFIPSSKFLVVEKNSLHSFCHANGLWHLMGCILSAASCRKWWLEDILKTNDYNLSELEISKVKCEEIYFLPYLMGERSPHNDIFARGAFIGLCASTTRFEMEKAIMEGVAFAIRDCLEIARNEGIFLTQTNLCGGGAKSAIWRQIFADILNLPINILQTEQGPAYGACILAMVGCKEYDSIKQASSSKVKLGETIYPINENVVKYEAKYQVYKRLYPALKSILEDE